MKKKSFILLLLILIAPVLFAQQLKSKKAEKAFRNALESFRQKNYEAAEYELNKCLRLDSTATKVWLLKAETEREQGQVEQAIQAYTKVIRLDKTGIPKVYFSLGNLQFKQGKYAGAEASFKTFLDLSPKGLSGLQHKAMLLLKSARFAQNALLHPDSIQLTALNSMINTSAGEYINFVNANNRQLIFTRKYPVSGKNEKLFREQFFKSVKKEGAQWQLPRPMAFPWAKDLNMGGLSLTPDGRQLYFTGCYWPGAYGGCDIFESGLRGKQWQKPKNTGKPVNTSSWDSQPCISADGHHLYFASKRPGGKGGSDIWMSTKGPSGKWLPPVNLGDSVNTAGDEMGPFLHADNQTLYFSSNGWPGMGGFDLFVSRKDAGGHWSRPQNLGVPVNSKADEKNLFVNIDGRQAWISSSRSGNMDIYTFNTFAAIHPQPTFFVDGKILDAQSEKVLKAKVVLSDLEQKSPVDSTWSDPVDGHFFMVLHPGKEVAFHIFKKGYLFYSRHFNLKKYSGRPSVSAVFYLQPIQKGARLKLENVLFDFDRFTLRPEAYAELNLLVRLLRQNQETKILVAGYTDSIGTAQHNMTLSIQRAKVVYDYLVSKGISPDRIAYKGFGAQHPLDKNDTETGRAQNRRTEIIIR